MKIVLIDTNASTASIGKITFSLYNELKRDGHDVLIIHGHNDGVNNDCVCITNKFETKLHLELSKLTGLNGYYSNIATGKAIKTIKDFNPDLVQLFNLHGWYLNINRLLRFLKKNKIPTVYSMLDEFPYLGRCCYSFECNEFQHECKNCAIGKDIYPQTRYFKRSAKIYSDKKKTYSAFEKLCFAGPKWVLERASLSPSVNSFPMYEVDEFVDVDTLFVPRTEYKYIDSSLAEETKTIILTVAVYSNPRKGGQYFIDLAKQYENESGYLFVFVGMDRENVELPKNCKAYGFVSNQEELAEYYSVADLFVCTSMADTMPNSCLEALSCGTPILGFNITGIPYVADEPLGYFVEAGNIDELSGIVQKTVKKNKDLVNSCRKYAVERYSLDTFYQKMISVYNEILKSKRSE